MSDLGFKEAFRHYNARLANPMWAVSAISEDGELVLSCWAHLFKPGSGKVLRYEDQLGRWANNELGQRLLRDHLTRGLAEGLDVRLVIATASDPAAIDSGVDASTIRKTFNVRDDLLGRIVTFDGDRYVVEFTKARKPDASRHAR